jgi:hypothetical protein
VASVATSAERDHLAVTSAVVVPPVEAPAVVVPPAAAVTPASAVAAATAVVVAVTLAAADIAKRHVC